MKEGGYYRPEIPFKPPLIPPRILLSEPIRPSRKKRGVRVVGFKMGKKRKKSREFAYFVMPDLLTVTKYEGRTGKEAISPRLTAKVKRSFWGGIRGSEVSYRIPTLQQQRTTRRR